MKKLLYLALLAGLWAAPTTVWAQDETTPAANPLRSAVFPTTDLSYLPGDIDAGFGVNIALADIGGGWELAAGATVAAAKADSTGTAQGRYGLYGGACWERRVCPMFGYDARTKAERFMVKFGLVEW